ncbi:MAG TPA: hypothetical protein VEU73_13880 [Gemmatimonadales bacterium]|nr:hypothetical protein [Gemmatimonadales bacterium]
MSIADRLIKSALHNRNEQIRTELYRRQDDAVRDGRAGMAYYRQEQEAACIREMNERVDAIWSVYRRIIVEASVPWTDDIRRDVVQRIETVMDHEVPYVEDMARDVIVQHGHGFDLFLRDASKGMRERIEAEMDLFGVRYRPVAASVILQLQADRYAGPRQHWTETLAALRSTPARTTHAAREAILALEGLAKIVAESPNETLGGCIKVLKKRGLLDGATANSLDALWGLVNTTQGLRHGATEEQTLPHSLAGYIVSVSEAALKLLFSLDAPAA